MNPSKQDKAKAARELRKIGWSKSEVVHGMRMASDNAADGGWMDVFSAVEEWLCAWLGGSPLADQREQFYSVEGWKRHRVREAARRCGEARVPFGAEGGAP